MCLFWVPGATANNVGEQSLKAILKVAQQSFFSSKLKENEHLKHNWNGEYTSFYSDILFCNKYMSLCCVFFLIFFLFFLIIYLYNFVVIYNNSNSCGVHQFLKHPSRRIVSLSDRNVSIIRCICYF